MKAPDEAVLPIGTGAAPGRVPEDIPLLVGEPLAEGIEDGFRLPKDGGLLVAYLGGFKGAVEHT